MRRLMTHSIRLIMDHASTLFSIEYLDIEQSTNNSSPASSKSSGHSHAYPRTSLFTLLGVPSLTVPVHSRGTVLTYGIDQPLNTIMTFGSMEPLL